MLTSPGRFVYYDVHVHHVDMRMHCSVSKRRLPCLVSMQPGLWQPYACMLVEMQLCCDLHMMDMQMCPAGVQVALKLHLHRLLVGELLALPNELLVQLIERGVPNGLLSFCQQLIWLLPGEL